MNTHFPVVSVIIPTYNQADLLQRALKSVINQSFQNWEAIVIDNYSHDNTQEITESFNDPRIRYVAFSNKGIIAASRNHGIHLATGEHIAFLDSDDLWYPSKLATCLDCIKNGADAVCHGLWIRKDGILQKKMFPKRQYENIYKTLLYNGNAIITTSTVLIKKQCFNKFGVFSEDPEIVTAEDYDLWLRLSKGNVCWGFISEILGEYTIHSKNASKNVDKQMRAEEKIVIKFFEEIDFPQLGEQLSYRKRRMMVVFRAGKRVWQSGHHCESIPYFFKGIFTIFD
jgi:glycosyltransferase involved in cell wall biosynthesis